MEQLKEHPETVEAVRARTLEVLAGGIADQPEDESESPDEDDPMGIGDML